MFNFYIINFLLANKARLTYTVFEESRGLALERARYQYKKDTKDIINFPKIKAVKISEFPHKRGVVKEIQ